MFKSSICSIPGPAPTLQLCAGQADPRGRRPRAAQRRGRGAPGGARGSESRTEKRSRGAVPAAARGAEGGARGRRARGRDADARGQDGGHLAVAHLAVEARRRGRVVDDRRVIASWWLCNLIGTIQFDGKRAGRPGFAL